VPSSPRFSPFGESHGGGPSNGPLDDRSKLSLLFVLARAPGGRSTQRAVATALGLTKVEARRLLRAAVAEGLVEETLDDSRSAPGRRVFSITEPEGLAELDRLQRGSRRAT
jgi:DNA-binding MarR family transcriptional regulator